MQEPLLGQTIQTEAAQMITDSMLPELDQFRALEQKLPMRWASDMAHLVIFGQNEELPVHNWFRFKEGFSSELLPYMLKRQNGRSLRLLDPFAGACTTLLSSQLFKRAHIEAVGIEANPFLHFVGTAKLSWRKVDPTRLLQLGSSVLAGAAGRNSRLPRLSSITTGRCISRHIASKIVGIRDVIRDLPNPYRDVLLLGLASCIEPLSRVRKDGRALRIVERSRQNVNQFVLDRWASMADDVIRLKEAYPSCNDSHLYLGDGRKPLSFVAPGTIDIALTSPPYPNNIDYSEVYKLELWMLGFIETPEAFLQLRKSTLRSHQSSDLGKPEQQEEAALIDRAMASDFAPLLERSMVIGEAWRKRLVRAYFLDIWNCLEGLHKSLKGGGEVFWVVANSLHGGRDGAFLIPADILTARLAQHVGFHVREITVARNMKRRLSGNHFLRESVLVLRKPADV